MSTKREHGSRFPRPDVAISNRIERLGEEAFAYLLLVPTFLLLLAIAMWPLAETFWMSLHSDDLTVYGVGEFIAIENYTAVITGVRDPFIPQTFLIGIAVTLGFAFVSVALETIIGGAQALVLDQEFRGRAWVRVAIILPWAVPIVIQGMMFYLMFAPGIGFATDPLQDLGVFSATPLSATIDSLIIIIIADVWKTSAFMALIILAGLQSVDRSLYDVGRVAGATPWQRFKMITFPLILPAVLVAMLFRTLQAMQVYGVIVTISSCRTVPSLTCMVVHTFRSNRFATSATLAFITALIISIFIGIYLLKFVESLREIGGDV